MNEANLYVDSIGQIWKGRLDGETLHYAKLRGVTNGLVTGVIQPIWTLEVTEPDDDWLLIGKSI